MDKALIVFGILIIIVGIVVFYLTLVSVMNLGQSIKDQSSGLPQLQEHEITISAPISVVIILIGAVIVVKSLKR